MTQNFYKVKKIESANKKQTGSRFKVPSSKVQGSGRTNFERKNFELTNFQKI